MAGLVEKRRQLHALFGSYSRRIERLYDNFINKLTDLAHDAGVGVETLLKTDAMFGFSNYPELQQEFNRIFSDYVQKDVLAYKAGITDGVALAYSHDKALLTGFSVLSDKAISHARNIAAETFIRSRMRTAKGLSLSQLVWNYAQQSKSEFEVAVSNVISDGLKKGTSAEELGRMVREYLNNPDMMYRRYHRTILDANGNKKDVVKWRRRIVDENGKVRFVEEPLEQVGMGHYRSSRKNANRLMRTEINGAYHRANSERWQQEPFVIGIAIELSPQHPEEDMCDFLSGENFEDPKGHYPKDFVFTGWHPQCLCMSNPITIQGEEKKEFYRRLAAGEDMSNYVSPNAVKDIPDTAKQWIDDNRDKFIRAGERGKLGYIWQDNVKYWQKQFTADELRQMGYERTAPIKLPKTEEEKAAIRQRWQEHQLTRAQIEIKNTGFISENNPRIVPYMDALKASIKTGDYSKFSKALQDVRLGIATEKNLVEKTARNVLKVANTYREVDGLALEKAISMMDFARMQSLTKDVARDVLAIRKQYGALADLIPNIHEMRQAYTLTELQEAHSELDGVMKKWLSKYNYASLDKAPLEHLKNKLTFELSSPTISYSQKEIINKAINEQIKLIDRKIEWENLVNKTKPLKAFDTKSPVYKNLLAEIDLAIQRNDMSALQEAIANAEKKQQKILKSKYKRDGSKGGALNSEYKGGVTGRDMTAEIDTRTMVSEDPYRGTYTNNVARLQGFDAPAKLVTAEEFDLLVSQNGDIFFRTVKKTTYNGVEMTSKEFAAQLYKADLLELNGPGGRAYGDGMYVATSAWNGQKVSPLKEIFIENARDESLSYGRGKPHTLSEMTWTRKPKIIRQGELEDMFYKLPRSVRARFDDNANTFGCALGYDAMYCDGPNYMVIWNRSIIAVKNT